jgi:hydrophobe/amphiphile efflux-1 (HAE1) family protein
MFSFFIKKPILSMVISIIIVICGVFALLNLPLAQYPNITPPTITISAHYPMANASVIEKTVASVIEDQINGTTDMVSMNSTMSSSGDYNLIISYGVDTNLNVVIGDVLNRLNSALPILPSTVQSLGVTMRKSSQNLLMSLSFQTNGQYDNVYLSNYIKRTIYTELSRIKGVGDIEIDGDRNYAMQIKIKPDMMAKLGITLNDIKNVILEQNIQTALGKTGYPPTDGKNTLSLNLNTKGYFTKKSEFDNIIVKNEGINFVYLKDVADVSLGAFSYDSVSKLNHTNAVTLQIYLANDANQIIVEQQIKKSLSRLEKQLPIGISFSIAFDNTKFIKESLNNVVHTFIEASILVILVIFLFLQKPKATIIPILTIPVAIIGTFCGMLMTGFSINNLTLFGLILSIGIVVDDSIVVIENVERVMEHDNLSALKASIKTIKEVGGALIAIVLVLCCAFIPSTFLKGISGILYKQFAITISISVVISGIVALTLTPALCSLLLKPQQNSLYSNKFFTWFNQFFAKITNYYLSVVKFIIKNSNLSMVIYFLIVAITTLFFVITPKGFIPNEDKGYLIAQLNLAKNMPLDMTESVTNDFISYMLKNHNVSNVISGIGIDILNSNSIKSNVASVTINLVDWDKRHNSNINDIIEDINKYSQKQENVSIFTYNPELIQGISATDGVEFYIQDKVSGNYQELQNYVNLITKVLENNNKIAQVINNFSANDIAIMVKPNVAMAKYYGVNISDIYNLLQTNFGVNLVNYFYQMGSLYWVILQGNDKYKRKSFTLNNLYLKNQSGLMVPISQLVSTNYTTSPQVITRFNDYLAAKLVVIPKTGYAVNDIMQDVKSSCNKILPTQYAISWSGISSLQQNNNSSYLAFCFAIVMIFLVLAALFELWSLPLVVILAVPFALFGAIVTIYIFNFDNNLYFQISLITLLGLSAKNSILISEFAIQEVRQGLPIINAIMIACEKRFRPIIMTSMAFILGAIPLVYSSGANANAQHSIGVGIIGGMFGSTIIATIFVPWLFILIINKRRK